MSAKLLRVDCTSRLISKANLVRAITSQLLAVKAVRKMAKTKHEPVELTESAKRKLKVLRAGGGAKGQAAKNIASRADGAARARSAADKALGITRR